MALMESHSYVLWAMIQDVRERYINAPFGIVCDSGCNRPLPLPIQRALTEMVRLMRAEMANAEANKQEPNPQTARLLAVLEYHERESYSILPKDPVTLAAMKAGLERLEAEYKRQKQMENCKI